MSIRIDSAIEAVSPNASLEKLALTIIAIFELESVS